MPAPLPDPAPTAHLTDPVLVEHDGVVVCNKPSGLPTAGRDLTDPWCLQGLMMARRQRRKVWAVHQLDRDTSGLNLLVLKKPLVPVVSGWLAAGTKTYLAVVHGRVRGPRAVTAPIGWRHQGRKRFPAVAADGRAASSHVSPISVGASHSVVAVRIDTGRTHQVRLHLAHIGHPLVGERLHRAPSCTLAARHALHAWQLALPAAPPELAQLTAPVPADLVALAARLQVDLPSSTARAF